MATAEELLKALGSTTDYGTVGSESEPHIVIGRDRIIRIPDELKRLGVQYDHNIETLTFDCPRYWDGYDMSKMKIYINCRLPDDRIGSILAKNVTAVGDVMHFDWTITNYVTQADGRLAFLVCVKKTDDNGEEVNHWNSELNTEAYISEGLEVTETITTEHADIITQLLIRMDAVEAIATPEVMRDYADAWLNENGSSVLSEIENKGVEVLESIPADYTEAYNLANEAARTKGDAVTNIVEGTAITVADSSNDYIRNIRILGRTEQTVTTGKNLANPEFVNFGIGSTGDEVTVMEAVEYRSMVIGVTPGKIYTISRGALVGSRFRYGFAKTSPRNGTILYSSNRATTTIYDSELSVTTIPVPDDCYYMVVYLTNTNSTEHVERTWYQVEEGEVATEYEPYTGGMASPSPEYPQELISACDDRSLDVYVNGANLANIPDTNSYTVNGITWACSGGVVTAKGTSTAISSSPANYKLPIIPGTYYVSGSKDGVTVYCAVTNADGKIEYYNNRSFVLDGTERQAIAYCQVNGNVVIDATIYPMVNVGTTPLPWEPYKATQTMSVTHNFCGIPVETGGNYTDVNGQQWICDEIDFERGVYIRRIGTQHFTGHDSENWRHQGSMIMDRTHLFQINIPSSTDVGNIAANDFMCDHFTVGRFYNIYGVGVQHTVRDFYFRIPSTTIGMEDSGAYYESEIVTFFRQWLSENPVTLYYVLATPVETALTASELKAFGQLRTNHPNTTVRNESSAHMEMKYNVDTNLFIKNTLPKPTDAQVAAAVDAWLEAHFTSAEGVSF